MNRVESPALRRRHALCLLGATTLWPVVGSAQPPALLLARTGTLGDASLDVGRYLVSEKFDGVRAVWQGGQLRFRHGALVPAPAWFTAKLPAQDLDGELWLGRGRFDALSSIVRRAQPVEADWQAVRFMVFEMPGTSGSFADRARRLVDVVAQAGWPALVAVEQASLPDRAALRRRFQAVLRGGGEGLMLHRADAAYVTGRSDVLVKLKPIDDDEARVTGYLPGKGRHAGRVGALLVQREDGVTFALGSGLSDAQRTDPPPVGSWVTYTYRGLTPSGRPRFATYRRRAEPA